MKNAFAICFYFLTATISSAQSVDSLKILLANSKPDTNRVFILELLVGPYFISNPDLAMKYAQEGLKLSEDLRFPKGKAILLWRIGGILQRTGRYPEAIERLFQSLKISEQIPLPLYTSLNQYVIAKVYMDQEDFQKANDYLFQAKKTQETIRNQFHLSVTLRTLGENYYKQNRLDSSLFFLQQSYQIGLKSITPDFQPIFDDVFKDIGQVYSKLGDNEQAMIYLKKSIPLSVNEQDYSNLSEAYLEIAHLWQQSNHIDSCIIYAEKALEAAQAISYPKGVLAANEFLSQTYEPINEHKAYIYNKQAMAVKDSLFNADKARQVQNMEFVEQQRKQAIEVTQLKSERQNQKIILIFLFIILSLTVLLLGSVLWFFKSKSKEKLRLHQQELLHAKLEIQEQTYLNISQELHDNVGQVLTVVKMTINTVGKIVSGTAKDKIDESVTLLSKAIQDIRDISKTLNTDFLNEVSLDSAIDQQLQIIKRTGLYSTELSVSGDGDQYSHGAKLLIFRVVQELLNNIVKHAGAEKITVSINYETEKMVITVQDNGQGFDTELQRLSPNKGLGLRNIHNRLRLIKGSVFFQSETGKGTVATIEIQK